MLSKSEKAQWKKNVIHPSEMFDAELMADVQAALSRRSARKPQSTNPCEACTEKQDYLEAVMDVWPIFTRLSVNLAYVEDLLKKHNIDVKRVLNILGECQLLVEDGNETIACTGLQL